MILSPEEVCDFLKKQVPSISCSILEKIKEHKIDGEVFVALNDEYLREIAPLLGDRLKIKRAIATALAVSCAQGHFAFNSVIRVLFHSLMPSLPPT